MHAYIASPSRWVIASSPHQQSIEIRSLSIFLSPREPILKCAGSVLLPGKGEPPMSRKVGQIIARGERRWLVRVYLGRDLQTRKRTYHNRTIYGSLRYAQAYLTRRLHERDLSRGVEGLQCTVNEFLDHWLKTGVEPKVRGKTYSDYAAMLRRYIRPAIGTRILASLSPLEIQSAYQIMIDRKLSARTVRYAHAVLRAAIRQAIRWHLLLSDPTQGVQLPSPQCREMSVGAHDRAGSIISQGCSPFHQRVPLCRGAHHRNAPERVSRALLARYRLGSWNRECRPVDSPARWAMDFCGHEASP